MKRQREEIEFIWVHMNIVGLNLRLVRDRVTEEIQKFANLRNTSPSANINFDRTEALVKVPAGIGWKDLLPDAIKARVIHVYREGEGSALRALVKNTIWQGPDYEG